MNWDKSMLIDYPLPFDHDASIRINRLHISRHLTGYAGNPIDVHLVSIRIFQAEAEDKQFGIRYYDQFKNAFTAVELIAGYIKHIPGIKREFDNEDLKPEFPLKKDQPF